MPREAGGETGRSARRNRRPPGPLFLVAFYLAVCVAAFLAIFLAGEFFFDRGGGGREDLLAEGTRLMRDGFFEDAERCFDKALAMSPGGCPEAAARKVFLSRLRGAITKKSFVNEVRAFPLDPPYCPPGFKALVKADTAVMEGRIEEARPSFEAALAVCGERLRFDVLHAVDHLCPWAATRSFCLCLRVPPFDAKRRVLNRMTFRPYEDGYLSLFLCSPGKGVRLLYPRPGRGDDLLRRKGDAVFVDFFRDSGKRLFLPRGGGVFFCALETAGHPDRDLVAARLEAALRDGGGGGEAAAALSGEFGAEHVVTLAPTLHEDAGSDR